MAIIRGEGTVTATASVGYPQGHNWHVHWLKTTKHLARLREIYQTDPANSIDLIAISGCRHDRLHAHVGRVQE
jgi:hypothetical protein